MLQLPRKFKQIMSNVLLALIILFSVYLMFLLFSTVRFTGAITRKPSLFLPVLDGGVPSPLSSPVTLMVPPGTRVILKKRTASDAEEWSLVEVNQDVWIESRYLSCKRSIPGDVCIITN
ncbi:MAG: hypothetical protein AAGI69_28700 [Cyanobacteria bacterium P01_H01_bin.21]